MKNFEEHLRFPSNHEDRKQTPAEQKFSDSVEYFRRVFKDAGVDADVSKKFLTILQRDIGFLTEFQSMWGIKNIAEKNVLLRAIALAIVETQGMVTFEERDDISEAIDELSRHGNGTTDENWLYMEIVSRKNLLEDLQTRFHPKSIHHEHASGVEVFGSIQKELHQLEDQVTDICGAHQDVLHRQKEESDEKKMHHVVKGKHKGENAAEHEMPQQQMIPEDVIIPNNDDDDDGYHYDQVSNE